MPRWAAKVDTTHREIVEALRRLGWAVADTSRCGGGVPDVFASRAGAVIAIEIKAGKGKLRASQERFRSQWQGAYVVCRSVEDVLALH